MKLTILIFIAFCSKVFGSSENSASNFDTQFLMNSSLDRASDAGNEQVNFSRISGIKKAQETLLNYVPFMVNILQNLEYSASLDGSLFSQSNLDEMDNWGKAERIRIAIGNPDTTNVGTNIDSNASFNVCLKFAKEHHNHHLDDIAVRFVPQISESLDGEFSIQGWYCETDIDWVDFTKNWLEPADSGSATVNQGVKGQRSIIMRNLPYPLNNCTITQDGISLPSEEDSTTLGINDDLVTLAMGNDDPPEEVVENNAPEPEGEVLPEEDPFNVELPPDDETAPLI